MESYLNSQLDNTLSYKNEVKSVTTLQYGSKYGFVLEIESLLGKFYCPVEGYRTKEAAFQALKKRLK